MTLAALTWGLQCSSAATVCTMGKKWCHTRTVGDTNTVSTYTLYRKSEKSQSTYIFHTPKPCVYRELLRAVSGICVWLFICLWVFVCWSLWTSVVGIYCICTRKQVCVCVCLSVFVWETECVSLWLQCRGCVWWVCVNLWGVSLCSACVCTWYAEEYL